MAKYGQCYDCGEKGMLIKICVECYAEVCSKCMTDERCQDCVIGTKTNE